MPSTLYGMRTTAIQSKSTATAEDWDLVQSINSRGVFLSYKYAAAQMVAQGRGGRIIGASSMAGKKGII